LLSGRYLKSGGGPEAEVGRGREARWQSLEAAEVLGPVLVVAEATTTVITAIIAARATIVITAIIAIIATTVATVTTATTEATVATSDPEFPPAMQQASPTITAKTLAAAAAVAAASETSVV
jgi:hypothetical protein